MKSKIPGSKTILMGGTGTGKTFALRSLVEAGITPFIIFTEPGMETLSDTLPDDKLSSLLKKGEHPYHYHYIPPVVSDWKALQAIGDNVNKHTYEALCKMTDSNKGKYQQWIEVIKTNNDFVCDECGQHFSDVQSWGTDRALVVDSLTGFAKMAMRLHIGGKVAKSPSDYGIAQDMVMKLLDAWTTATRCWFVLIAHEEKTQDQVTGAISRMPKSVGTAINPEIPNFFSDVIETIRTGSEFYWDTAAVGADVKARNLPISSKIPPSFVPLVTRWKEKGGVIESGEENIAKPVTLAK
jgi:hypothetical protein